jgi:hypothetical protein
VREERDPARRDLMADRVMSRGGRSVVTAFDSIAASSPQHFSEEIQELDGELTGLQREEKW